MICGNRQRDAFGQSLAARQTIGIRYQVPIGRAAEVDLGNRLQRVACAHDMALHGAAGNAVTAELAQAVVGDLGQAGITGIDHQDEGVQCDGGAGNQFGIGRQLGLDVGDYFGLGGGLWRER